MKVKFRTSIAGRDFCYGAGEVLNLPNSEAESFIRAGIAVKDTEEETIVAKRPLIPEVKKEKKPTKKVQTRPV
jgi:hypothetical protein